MNIIAMLMTFAAFFVAISVHYASQGLIASLLGDGSPAREGRLSLNPVRHLTPLGACVALIAAFPISGLPPIGLGWGRRMQANVSRFSVGPNAGLIILGLTGIVANVLLGAIIALALHVIPFSGHDLAALNSCYAFNPLNSVQGCFTSWQPGWALRLIQFFYILAGVNITVGLLNIIPLAPLDGYNILFALLPERPAIAYRNSENYQELILFFILFVLPFLLAFSRFPVQIDLIYYFGSWGYQIAQALSQIPYQLVFVL